MFERALFNRTRNRLLTDHGSVEVPREYSGLGRILVFGRLRDIDPGVDDLMARQTWDSSIRHRRGAAGISTALAAIVLLAGVVGCASSQTTAPQPTGAPTTASPSSNAPIPGAPEGLTDAETALVVGAYKDGSGETTPVSIAPLSSLGVSAAELTVGDDTYAVVDCFAVAPSADALAPGDAVDRGGVHIVYLAPDGISAGYLGSYADLIR